MFKRIVSLAVVILMLSTLFCNVAYAAVFQDSSTITPMVKEANYEVYLRLNLTKPYTTHYAYVAVYNKNGRMIDMQYTTAVPRTYLYIAPDEYPVTIKAFVWSISKTGIPLGESYVTELKSANQIIADHLADFIDFIYESTSSGFMYELNVILDEIDEEIIEDAKSNELVIDRAYLNQKYPDTYSRIRTLGKSLSDTEKEEAMTALSTIVNNYPDYKQLVVYTS